MPDYNKHIILYSKAVHTIPVGNECIRNEEYIARAAIVKHAFHEQLNRKSLKYTTGTMRRLLYWKVYLPEVIERLRASHRRSLPSWDACMIPGAIQFDNDKWMQAFENTGIDIAFYNLRERRFR